jgi:hypothetical protein
MENGAYHPSNILQPQLLIFPSPSEQQWLVLPLQTLFPRKAKNIFLSMNILSIRKEINKWNRGMQIIITGDVPIQPMFFACEVGKVI